MAYLDCRKKGHYVRWSPRVENNKYDKRDSFHEPLIGQVIPYSKPILPPHLQQAVRAAFLNTQ